MLHTELVRLINSRECWALVGSGPSTEAGCPSWDRLLTEVQERLTADQAKDLEEDGLFALAQERGDLPAAFEATEAIIGREALEAGVRESLARVSAPGPMHAMLADLPFAGYITSNYDPLLELALNKLEPGWAPVGNVGDEVRKATGTAERVVWHIHGAVELDRSRSHLIITEEDYAQLYIDESRVLQQLRGLLAHRRIVVVGFGFRDSHMLKMLQTVGRLTDATRPIFALVEKAKPFKHTIDRQVFLRQYRVDVQPYANDDGRHQNLRSTLSVYAAMSLRRSLKFGQQLATPPAYDPETTGLLIYNDLVLGTHIDVPENLRISILQARILSLCETTPQTRTRLREDLDRLLEALVRRIAAPIKEQEIDESLDAALERLIADELLVKADGSFQLSPEGRDTVLDHAAASARLEEQFLASIRTRVEQLAAPFGVQTERPVDVVSAFFRDAIGRRALGVALAFATGGTPTQQEYHSLALLQSIGEWLDRANNEAEALAVVQTIQEVFRQPSPAESAYIATAVQARFVLHLLSLDRDTLAIRLREIESSVFLIDSSTLIPWLAAGSVGYDAARTLLRHLQEAGALVATTLPLAEEVSEHIRWAQRLIADSGGVQTAQVLEAATGRGGIKTNAFLEGYLKQYGAGMSRGSFEKYIGTCIGAMPTVEEISNAALSVAIAALGIVVIDFDTVAADHPTVDGDRELYARQIRGKRLSAASYKHSRQVRAEAEAIALVELARSGLLELGGSDPSNAYFISYTSLLNQVSRSSTPITMRPEAALLWLSTVRPASAEDIQALMSELLWELQERRMNIVDTQSLLSAFGPLVAAAKERLDEVLPRYQVLIAQRYGGEHPIKPMVSDLDAPVVLQSILYERVKELEQALAHQAVELEAAKQRAEMTEIERSELDRARTKEKRRGKYERRKDRQSGHGSGKKRRQPGH